MLELFNWNRAQHDVGALFLDDSLKKDAIISITNAKYAENLIYPGLLSAIDLYSTDDYPNSVPCESNSHLTKNYNFKIFDRFKFYLIALKLLLLIRTKIGQTMKYMSVILSIRTWYL
jgi:hypothetical protein